MRNELNNALHALSLPYGRLALGWVELAKGLGVEAAATDDAQEFARLPARGVATPGPFLIEARI